MTLTLGRRSFVDIGCADGVFRNNTVLLERAGWRGWLFDRNSAAIESCRKTRLSPVFQVNAETFDFKTCFLEQDVPRTIDYISFDVDGATERAFRNFPFEDYEFLVMTVEHDCFRSGPAKKHLIQERLSYFPQYMVLASDVQYGPGRPFEDWVINTRYFSPSVFTLKSEGMLWWDCIRHLVENHPAGFPTFPQADAGSMAVEDAS